MWAIYFSFTTLPSLGYGDITPQTPATQSYAVMEAALGQIFLTVVVARLVALQITHTQKTTPIDQPE
jgi:voltage-gated potassium channel Kch